MEWTHGGDVTGYALEYGRQPLDFSANVSPLGMPEGVLEAARTALAHSAAYPDPQCRTLRDGLAEKLSVPPEWILCGGGASDLIYRLAAALRPGEALITAPAFSEYEAALTLWDCTVRRFPLDRAEDFRLTERFLPWISRSTELVILGQPNNPTGLTVAPALLREILARCGRCGALLAVDECFLDFLEEPEAYSLLPYLSGRRLLVFRAFTKFYGLAGLRLGHCLCGDTALLRRMAEAGPPWPVSHVAQAAGVAALAEDGYAERLRTLVRRQRPVLRRELEACGLRVIPGEANYLLFQTRNVELGDQLRRRGVLIRDCRDYPGLEPGWYRTAVRTEEENRQLIAAIREVTG